MSDDFDVIVVGAGVTGAVVAKAVSEAGHRVLVLEAGTGDALDPSHYRSYVEDFYTSLIKATSAGYPPNSAAPSADVLHLDDVTRSYLLQQTREPTLLADGSWALPFSSDYVRMVGGTTLHWQGETLRMVPNDFRMHSQYGRGVDWPITYDDLIPDYERAEFEIGVAAEVEEQCYLGITFPDGYRFPMHKMPQSYLDQFVADRVGGLRVKLGNHRLDVRVISVPQGRNATPNADYAHPDGAPGYEPVGAVGDRSRGLRCQGNSSCLPICPVQAKYSALKTIDKIRRRSTVKIVTQAVVSRLIIDKGTRRITGVEYKRYERPNSARHSKLVARGKVVVLAAHAIENVTLLLASGAGASNRHLGCNLMDHPYLYIWGSAPEPVYPFRGPHSTSGLDSLRDGKFREQFGAFRASLCNWGWNGSPSNDVHELLNQRHYGADLRQKLRKRLIRQILVGIMVEQLPDPKNRVTIDPNQLDRLGNHRPVIDYRIDDYCLRGLQASRTAIGKVFKRCNIDDHTRYENGRPGFRYLTYRGEGYNLMGAGHIVGTHRMGRARRDSVVNKHLRSWEHDNLYLVGCGSMPTIGTSNPTLTAVALAFRAAREINRVLR